MGPKNFKSAVGIGFSALVTSVTLAYSAYRFGMFFDVKFYRLEWMIIVAALMLAVIRAVYSGLGRQKESTFERSEERHKFKYTPNVPGPVLGLLWMAFLYLLSLMHEPASVQSTIEQSIRWSTYAAYMWLAAAVFGSVIGRRWLSAAIQAAGAFVIWGALAGWMGCISFPAIVMTTGDLRLSAIGARLSGFVQYPNFLGAVMSAYLVWFWLLLVRARSNSAFWFAAVQVVPVLLVLLLTESRGAWLVGALSWVVGLVLVSRDERPIWLLYSGFTLAAAGGAYRFVVHIGGRSGASSVSGTIKGMTIEALSLFAIIAVALAVFALIRRLIIKEDGRHRLVYFAWSGWAAAVIMTVLLLPAVVHERLNGHFQTAAARKLFYTDALLLIKKSPLLGQGGDTWRMLFSQIQTQPYTGTEVHSGYLDVMLDLGVVGLISLILVLTLMLRLVWVRDRAGLLPIIVLLAHASIDFDMSFGYYWLLLLSWVVLYSGFESAPGKIERPHLPPQKVLRHRYPIIQATAILLAAMLLTASAAYSWRFDRSVQYRKAALAASGSAREAALRAALGANPYWSRVRTELAKLAPPQERAALLGAGLRYEPQSVPLLSGRSAVMKPSSAIQRRRRPICAPPCAMTGTTAASNRMRLRR